MRFEIHPLLVLLVGDALNSSASSPPTRRTMPPVMATRDLRSLSPPPQVVHFIPMQATPRPEMDTMMPTIIRARVAWREPAAARGEENSEASAERFTLRATRCREIQFSLKSQVYNAYSGGRRGSRTSVRFSKWKKRTFIFFRYTLHNTHSPTWQLPCMRPNSWSSRERAACLSVCCFSSSHLT